MKKLLVCGMLLGLLTSLSFAQRGRAIGGVGTSARVPPSIGTISPNARVNPSSISIGHGGILPNATTMGKTPKTITPNATTNPRARTIKPDATAPRPDVTVPNAHISPDAAR